MILALSGQRAVGAVIAVLVIGGFILYAIVNALRMGSREIGAEIEQAPNRKQYLSDDELEGRALDTALGLGLATLGIIAVALPLYWLGEPGRHLGRLEIDEEILVERGEHSFEERCASCHGPDAAGSLAPFTVTDSEGRFVDSVNWNAPALDTVLQRFSTEEVEYVITFGRPNSPMPAWGVEGGGPLNEQQVEELMLFLEHNQLSAGEIEDQVDDGIRQAARAEVIEASGEFENPDDLEAATDTYLAGLDPAGLGNLVFNNPIAGGAYGCARCHTAGFSWDSSSHRDGNPEAEIAPNSLIAEQVPGGGGFGPNLTGGVTVRQFEAVEDHIAFVAEGTENAVPYGTWGQGDGGGQMPGFGALLTEEQIAAVVAYERGL